jgi:hypothetical protein
MTFVEKLKNITSKNTALCGGISPGPLGEKRVKGLVTIIADAEDPTGSSELSLGVTTDWYHHDSQKADGSVSIEGAYGRESDIRDVLDGRITANNLGWDDEGSKGLKPCDLLRKSKTLKRRPL